MNKFITKPVIGIFLSITLFTQHANSQAVISGHIFNDANKNGSYDAGEGLQDVTVWLLDKAAVSPYYMVYPVQTAVTSVYGDFSFTNVANGNYQVRVKMSTTYNGIINGVSNSRITTITGDNNPYASDKSTDGITDLTVSSASTYSNIDFGFISDITPPIVLPQRRFAFDNSTNSFVNVMSKTFNLAPENCSGNIYNPSLTITTDKQFIVSSQVYPQAGSVTNPNGIDWPGPNKGGFYTDDVTMQMDFGQTSYSALNNDLATLTLNFSNLVRDVRFTIYDIDCSNPQLVDGSIDHVRVTGYNGATAVMPVITLTQNMPFNTISGNSISGWPDYPDNNVINNYPDSYNSGNADNGNANIYFTDIIDKVVIEYEEYAPVLIPSSKKILVPVSPINNESQWDVPATPSTRGISVGSIGYTFYCTLLAADLLSFDAKAVGQKVNLQWKKEDEQQIKQYRIERLTSNGSWTSLGNIAAAGSGHTYHFTDLRPVKGVNQYRLALLNQDATFHLSAIRKVNVTAATGDIEIISNPAPSLNLVAYGDVKNITIFDEAGQQLFEHPVKQNTTGTTTISLNQFALYTGFYFVKALFGNGEVKTLKFIKQ